MYNICKPIKGNEDSIERVQNFLINCQKDTEILIKVNPISVMFGNIECFVQFIELLSNGWLRIYYFHCPQNLNSSAYHLIIPAKDIFEWFHCNSHSFSAIICRLKKESIIRVKTVLELNEDFNQTNSFITFILNQTLDVFKYKRFLDVLNSEGVLLRPLNTTEAKVRYECAKQKKSFNQQMLSNPIPKEVKMESKPMDSIKQLQQNSINSLIQQLLTEKIKPKKVLFGTYDCKLQSIELIAFKNINFFGVQQNNKTEEQFLDIKIPLSEVQLILVCLDSKLPTVFMRLSQSLAKVIQISVHLRKVLNNKFIYDINSDSEREQYVKIVFNEHQKSALLFFLMIGFETLTIRQISYEEAIKLLDN